MSLSRLSPDVPLAVRPRRTVRLRLTLWYGGLFLLSGAALLGITYALVVQAFVGNTPATAASRQPGSGCHTISAGQARAAALQEHATVLHELLTRSEIALAVMAVVSMAVGRFIVQAIAQAHGASISACPHQEGGLHIEVTFPDPHVTSPILHTPENYQRWLQPARGTQHDQRERQNQAIGIQQDLTIKPTQAVPSRRSVRSSPGALLVAPREYRWSRPSRPIRYAPHG